MDLGSYQRRQLSTLVQTVGKNPDLAGQIDLLFSLLKVVLRLLFFNNLVIIFAALNTLLAAVNWYTVLQVGIFLHIVGCKDLHFIECLSNRIEKQTTESCLLAPNLVAYLHLKAQFFEELDNRVIGLLLIEKISKEVKQGHHMTFVLYHKVKR